MTVLSIATRTTLAAMSLIAGTTFCAGIASAREGDPRNAPAPAATAPAPATIALDRKVCVKGQLTGSRIPRTVCMARGEWIAKHNIDPVAAK